MPESRNWDLSDFRLQRLNPLPGLQEGEEEGVASQISSSAAAPTEGGGGEGQTDGRGSGAGAERGAVWKLGGRQPLSLGAQTAGCRGLGLKARWGEHVGTCVRTYRSIGHMGLTVWELTPAWCLHCLTQHATQNSLKKR